MSFINPLFVFWISFFSLIELDKLAENLPVQLHLETEIKENDDFFIGALANATLANNGDILILDYSQKKIIVFDSAGNLKTSFGRDGRGPGEFSIPRGVKTDHEGYIYVSDSGNARVTVWDPDYDYLTDIELRPGWRAKFNKNSSHLFVSIQPFGKLPNGNDEFVIYKIYRDKNLLEPFYTYEFNAREDWFDENRLFDSTSKWDMTDDGNIVASGKFDLSPIRIIDSQSGEVEVSFSEDLEPVLYTDEENELRLLANPNEEFRAIQAQRTQKQIYTNIQLSDRGEIWVHRNKEFGSQDEIDIYTLEAELKTVVTLPPSENEFAMYGIYGERILFHVTTPAGEERLHVYRIEYGR